MASDWPWNEPGRDLSALPIPAGRWNRVVACLNVWNDLDELHATLPTWIEAVDHVIAVDGAYMGTEALPWSTDGTEDYLCAIPKVEYIPSPEYWVDQRHKRSRYFEHGQHGDLFFIVDADESVSMAHYLRSCPDLDVGWLTVTSPLYQRGQSQPRVLRWKPGLRYGDRHHWIECDGQPIATHQRGGAGLVHRHLPCTLHNSRGARRSPARRGLAATIRSHQTDTELETGPQTVGHEPLRIAQTGPFDPGLVMYRLHTAINTTTPHWSAEATGGDRPYGEPYQYDFQRNRAILKDILATADVHHHHVTYVAQKYFGDVHSRAKTVIHHHGTEYRRDPLTWNERDAEQADLRLVSNLELLQYGQGLHYLPNPVPVARYLGLRVDKENRRPHPWADTGRKMRIAHSPTDPEKKGTATFYRVCEDLDHLVEMVPIVATSHREALELKATCHAVFDSFQLGIQCSGLEGAAMGQPVIAGDPDCLRQYVAWLGECPYTYANDATALREALERLATDTAFYEAETDRAFDYVMRYHDYANVAARYLDLLDEAVGWREMLQLGSGYATA